MLGLGHDAKFTSVSDVILRRHSPSLTVFIGISRLVHLFQIWAGSFLMTVLDKIFLFVVFTYFYVVCYQ